jgi:chaperone modulatory protein CbpM
VIMNKQQLLNNVGLQMQTLEVWLEHRWLVPTETSAEMTFSDADVARAHLIRDLKSDFGVNDEGIDIVLHLLDQLHGLRGALERMNREMHGHSP